MIIILLRASQFSNVIITKIVFGGLHGAIYNVLKLLKPHKQRVNTCDPVSVGLLQASYIAVGARLTFNT